MNNENQLGISSVFEQQLNALIGDVEKIIESETLPEIEYYEKSDLQIILSKDKILAFLRVNNVDPKKILRPDTVFKFFEENNIKYGIQTSEIIKYCELNQFFTDFIVARGVDPVPEKDGELIFKFEKEVVAKPLELATGNVDYFELGLIQQAKKWQQLCVIAPPSGGVDGVNVHGEIVPFKKGFMPKFPQGKNTCISLDGLSLLAMCEGVINYKDGIVSVSEVYTVDGDVDTGTGNVEFSGDILINGDVRAGFKVSAGGNVTIAGVCEGAYIEASGNVYLKSGVIGMKTGTIKAGGDVEGQYFENCTITCGGSIYAKYFVNCYASAKLEIIATDRIINGTYEAGKTIDSKTIGSEFGSNLALFIESPELDDCVRLMHLSEGDKIAITGKMSKLQNSLDELDENYNKVRSEGAIEKSIIMKILQYKNIIKKEIENCERKISEIKESYQKIHDYRVIARGIIYPGTQINIGPYTYNVLGNIGFSKFLINSGELTCLPLTPADRKK